MDTAVRVFLVDDSPYFLDVANDYLRMYPALEVTGMAAEAEAALEQTGRLQPDVILLDLNLGNQSGMKLVPRFKQQLPLVKIIILSIMSEAGYFAAALQAGADAFVPKARMTEMLIDTIRRLTWAVDAVPALEPPKSMSEKTSAIFMRLAEQSSDLIYR